MQSLSNVIKTQHKAKYSYNEWEDSKHNKRTDKKKHDRSQRQAKRNWS